jgi:aminomethyltransferase
MRIMVDGRQVGETTSGGYSPTLDMNIGLGYLPTKLSVPGTPIQIEVRDKLQTAIVVPLPFYSRARS